jgi:hypothetical protein
MKIAQPQLSFWPSVNDLLAISHRLLSLTLEGGDDQELPRLVFKLECPPKDIFEEHELKGATIDIENSNTSIRVFAIDVDANSRLCSIIGVWNLSPLTRILVRLEKGHKICHPGGRMTFMSGLQSGTHQALARHG